jgi:hypothetical protein
MTPRLSLGPLSVGLLSLLLLSASTTARSDPRLRDTTARLVFTAPYFTGAARTVVVELPPSSAGGTPVLVTRRLDAGYTAGASYQQDHDGYDDLRAGAALGGQQLPGNPESLVLDGQTAPTPVSFVLLAIALGLLLTRKSILLLASTRQADFSKM